MRKLWTRFLRLDNGQDLVEFVLLLAFVVIASSALFLSVGDSTQGIWNIANNHLVAGRQAASN